MLPVKALLPPGRLSRTVSGITTFDVETEALGEESPVVRTYVFSGGRIIDWVAWPLSGNDSRVYAHLINLQHERVLQKIGEADAIATNTEGDWLGINGLPAPDNMLLSPQHLRESTPPSPSLLDATWLQDAPSSKRMMISSSIPVPKPTTFERPETVGADVERLVEALSVSAENLHVAGTETSQPVPPSANSTSTQPRTTTTTQATSVKERFADLMKGNVTNYDAPALSDPPAWVDSKPLAVDPQSKRMTIRASAPALVDATPISVELPSKVPPSSFDLSSNASNLVVASLWGQASSAQEFEGQAAGNGLAVVEDCVVIDEDGAILQQVGKSASELAEVAFLTCGLEELLRSHFTLGECQGAWFEEKEKLILIVRGHGLCCALVAPVHVSSARAMLVARDALEQIAKTLQ